MKHPEYNLDNQFNQLDVQNIELGKEYENCVFKNTSFYASDLSGKTFINCTFEQCDLSLVKLNKASFQDVKFEQCKLLGNNWEYVNNFGLEISFIDCNLSDSNFFNLKLERTNFSGSQLRNCDFTQSNLSKSTFNNCDLTGARFDQTDVSSADFRNAKGYSIHPTQNKIKGAKFSRDSISGLLDFFQIQVSD